MVGLNGKVSNGAGNPAHKAGFDVEPMAPCITRQMTPEERKFYGVKETKGAKKKMGQKRGPRIDIGKLEELALEGFSVADIAKELNTTKEIIWARAKAHGLITKLRVNSDDAAELVKVPTKTPPKVKAVTPKQLTPEEVAELKKKQQPPAPAYPQDSEENEFRFLSPFWLNEIAKGLTKGDKKHPGATWRTIPAAEHAWRAIRHLILFLMGDKTDDHLINAAMRVMMAFETEGGRDD